MQTENIVKFLQTAYSDEKLAALLAHAQDGKLAFTSCCCFIGISTAEHALLSHGQYCDFVEHITKAREFPFGFLAEKEFNLLDCQDPKHSTLIPLIEAEIERREKLAVLNAHITYFTQQMDREPEPEDARFK